MQLSLVILGLIAISQNYVFAKPPSRIVCGTRVSIPDIPSIVMIRHVKSYNSTHSAICGGTIIDSQHILTAAHCFETDPSDPMDLAHPRWYQVIAGANSYGPNAKIYAIEEVYSHPNFTDSLVDDNRPRADIAVIKLKEKIRYSHVQKPMQLASKQLEHLLEGDIYGWGIYNFTMGAISTYLNGLHLTVLTAKTCKEFYSKEKVAEDELCLTARQRGAVCGGDSGGPVVVNGLLFGVISAGSSLCDNSMPGYAISVAYHKSWIEGVINGTAKAITYFGTSTSHRQDMRSRASFQPDQDQHKPYVRDELSSWRLLNQGLKRRNGRR